jgi:hypothetical protein
MKVGNFTKNLDVGIGNGVRKVGFSIPIADCAVETFRGETLANGAGSG